MTFENSCLLLLLLFLLRAKSRSNRPPKLLRNSSGSINEPCSVPRKDEGTMPSLVELKTLPLPRRKETGPPTFSPNFFSFFSPLDHCIHFYRRENHFYWKNDRISSIGKVDRSIIRYTFLLEIRLNLERRSKKRGTQRRSRRRSTKANVQANPYLDRDIGPVTFRPGGWWCFGVGVHGYPSKIPICPVVMRSLCQGGKRGKRRREKDRLFLRSIGR